VKLSSDIKRLSNSEAVSFRRCRRSWYLDTYRRLKPRVEEEAGSARWIGNLVHDALAWYYDPRATSNPVGYAKAVVGKLIEESPEQEERLTKEADLVYKMLEGYLEWLDETGADAELTILGSEQMAEAQLVEGINLISKLDAPVLRESDGARLALEHKTVADFSNFALHKIDTQFLTEHLVRFLSLIEQGAEADEAEEACHGILWNGLRKVKRTAKATPPFYMRDDIRHNRIQLRNHWQHVLAVAQEILATTAALDAGVDHHSACPPSPTRDCFWECDFFRICSFFDDGSDVEGAIEAMYVEANPLERYENTAPLIDSLR
jgi:PD-(D/E)XK nuclease superfamily